MNILGIDSADSKEIVVFLKLSKKKYFLKSKASSRKAQVILLLIEELLNKYDVDTKEIHKIEINTGPGSYTGLRVGVAIANTLAFLLRIPINNLPRGVSAEPAYK